MPISSSCRRAFVCDCSLLDNVAALRAPNSILVITVITLFLLSRLGAASDDKLNYFSGAAAYRVSRALDVMIAGIGLSNVFQ